ncbi:MAG: hypothetical protein CR986_05320 [Ignavibacteriae bacterium]|nr:MAG: hypothetical protein CR986_05320 [Ignavibacteriota bacterium]
MIPLFSQQQVREADNFAINKLKIPSSILMENAAISILYAILEKYPYFDYSYKFGIVCGKGNNGGDGFTLARQLLIRGFTVKVISLATESELKGDALLNYKITRNLIDDYENSGIKIYKSARDLNYITDCEIIIDAILGTGAFGDLREPYKSIVQKVNKIPALKIAIDSPTGLNLNNASGEEIFKANLTVTLAEMKTGLFYEKGKIFSGEVKKGSIGIGNSYFDNIDTKDFLIEPEDALRFLPKRNENINKYSAGKILVIGSSGNMPGAGIFAINSAMISGSGAGKIFVPKSLKQLIQSKMNSAIVSDYEDNNNGFLSVVNYNEAKKIVDWADAIAIGPGLGREKETAEFVYKLLEDYKGKRVVIDADAINALKNGGYQKFHLHNKVFTPHHKEFADLLGIELSELKQNLLNYGRKFTSETNSYLVLKGSTTIIFNPIGEIFINSSGNAGLAKFGSGDALTGLITSFIVQQESIEESIISAVYLHGLTADLIKKNESEFGIIPDKLINKLPTAIKFLRKSIV